MTSKERDFHPDAPKAHEPGGAMAMDDSGKKADAQKADEPPKAEWPKWMKHKATGEKLIVQSEDEFTVLNEKTPLIPANELADNEQAEAKGAKSDAKK